MKISPEREKEGEREKVKLSKRDCEMDFETIVRDAQFKR